MTTENAVKTKKINNRTIQRTHATYKTKSEIAEALHLIRPYINESTYRFLRHFLHTNGTGVTQAKIKEICKLAEISTGNYSKTVKPELDGTFSQPLIITTQAPMKWDSKRKKRVKSSEFKSFMPLSVIKHLVVQKQAEEQELYTPDWEQFLPKSDIESDIEGDIESNPSIPWESKDEPAFHEQQNKSFREKHLEKHKGLNRIRENESPKRYRINSDLKTGLDSNGFFNALEEVKQIQVANKIQLAYIRTNADFTDRELQGRVFEAFRRFINDIEKGHKKIIKDYYGALYVYVETAIYDYLIEQEQTAQEPPINDQMNRARDRYAQKPKTARNGFLGLYVDMVEEHMPETSMDEVARYMFGDSKEKRTRKDVTTESFKVFLEQNAEEHELLNKMGVY